MLKTLAPMLAVAVMALAAVAVAEKAADNTLTEAEKKDGWKLLFDGKSLDGWVLNNGKELTGGVEDGAIQTKGIGGYVVMWGEPVGDFHLKFDVKQEAEGSNSGAFFRVGDKGNPVHTGFEAQVEKPGTGMHSFGALYDLVPAKVNAVNVGQWNTMEIICKGPQITVKVNGQTTAELNQDEWPEYGKRPDGSNHKFKTAVKDLPRKGYFGFQDHGAKVWFKNVKLKEL